MSDGKNTSATADGAAVREAEALLALQESDIQIYKLRKQLEELPQRSKILEIRAKQREIQKRADQLSELHKESDRVVELLQREAKHAVQRRKEIQQKIHETTNYKETTNLVQELESYAKRKEELESDTIKQLEKIEKMITIEAQAADMLTRLNAQETEVVEDFKKEGGALQNAIGIEARRRASFAAHLDEALLQRYEKALKAKGGIGAAHIESNHCSACRLPFSEGQIAKMRAKGQIAECPFCHRLIATRATPQGNSE